MNKQYKIKINKFYDKETDCVNIELSVTKELTELLQQFAVTSGKINSNWLKNPQIEDSTDEFNYVERYLVKAILKNSVSWNNIYDLLFTHEILETQKIKVPLTSVNMFRYEDEIVRNIKTLVKTMVEIVTKKEINITLVSDEE